MSNKSEDRGMMKWAPFHSVISEDDINTYINKNTKNIKPELSDDQISEIEENIIFAYNNKSEIKLLIFNKYKNYEETGIISKLDPLNKIICINNKKINFNDILSSYVN